MFIFKLIKWMEWVKSWVNVNSTWLFTDIFKIFKLNIELSRRKFTTSKIPRQCRRRILELVLYIGSKGNLAGGCQVILRPMWYRANAWRGWACTGRSNNTLGVGLTTGRLWNGEYLRYHTSNKLQYQLPIASQVTF